MQTHTGADICTPHQSRGSRGHEGLDNREADGYPRRGKKTNCVTLNQTFTHLLSIYTVQSSNIIILCIFASLIPFYIFLHTLYYTHRNLSTKISTHIQKYTHTSSAGFQQRGHGGLSLHLGASETSSNSFPPSYSLSHFSSSSSPLGPL